MSNASSEHPIDTLSNYELHEEIAQGATSTVYRATCKRGRLRNRLVAVKKTASQHGTASSANHPIAAASLHATLCHPSIASLISFFTTVTGFYQVMDYCEHGSLADLLVARDPSVLTEDELRGVARTLVDTLVYLRKERVLHRDIKPSHILVASDYRLKLSGFSSAIRLPTIDSTETTFCGSANYVSPEILSGQSYSFPTDVWSLGCVLVTCLSGKPAFFATTPDKVFDNICSARYNLPDTVSYEVQDLISGLLQKNSLDRTPLHRILSHPFFQPSLPVKAISVPAKCPTSQHSLQGRPLEDHEYPPRPAKQYPSSLSRNPLRPKPPLAQRSKDKHAIRVKRSPLEDITNLYQDDSLDDIDLLQVPARRLVPVPVNASRSRCDKTSRQVDSRPPTPALTADSGTPSVSSLAALSERRDCLIISSALPPNFSSGRPLLASPRTQLKRVLSDPCTLPSRTQPRLADDPPRRLFSKATSSTAVSQGHLPESPPASQSFGTKHRHDRTPVKMNTFNSRRLKAQTHKVSRGQLVVLPSRAVLVDFREGERRKGRTGKEVLVISSDGRNVDVYDAPHLSTPCCLAEPVVAYTADQLPSQYAKLYDDAALLVDQLNSRIPKLVHYADAAKCTLMANGPPGDVELLLPGDDASSSDRRETIRLRLYRGKRTLEVSRHVSKAGSSKDVGEWMKKVLLLNNLLDLSGEDLLALDGSERMALACLGDFLRICDVVEGVEVSSAPGAELGDDGRLRLERVLRHWENKSEDVVPGVRERAPPFQKDASGVELVGIPPPPRKFSNAAMLR